MPCTVKKTLTAGASNASGWKSQFSREDAALHLGKAHGE